MKTGQFQELLKSLSQTANQLENQLTNHQGQSTQPDAVKKQLEDVQNISGQLREERKKLKEAEAINAELTAMVTEDYLKADLAISWCQTTPSALIGWCVCWPIRASAQGAITGR